MEVFRVGMFFLLKIRFVFLFISSFLRDEIVVRGFSFLGGSGSIVGLGGSVVVLGFDRLGDR